MKLRYGRHSRKQQQFWPIGTCSLLWLKRCTWAVKEPTNTAAVMYSTWYKITKKRKCITRMSLESILIPPFIPTSSYIPPIAIKVKTNQVACPLMMWMFCAGLGHIMHMCPVCQEYLNAGKVVRGQFSRLCLPDETEIPWIPGTCCLKDAIDHLTTLQSSTQSPSSASTVNTFS